MSKSSRDPSALIRAGKPRTAKFDVCLDLDLVEEYRALEAQRSQRLAETQDSLAGSKAPEFDEPLGALREQIEEATLTLTFQALSQARFRDLCDRHPSRKDDDGVVTVVEDLIGVNYVNFFPELFTLSLVDPLLDDEDVKILVTEKLDDRQWTELTDVLWELNRKRVQIPFSSAG